MVRRLLAVAALVGAAAACGAGAGRALSPYHDPEGRFSVLLPIEDDVAPSGPQQAASGPGLLSGVVATPPQASPASGTALGSSLTASADTDRTRFQILIVDGSGFASVGALSLYFLTGTDGFDVQIDRPTRLDGLPGRIVVGEATDGDRATAGVAAIFALSSDGTIGYVIASVFPPGGWGAEEDDLMAIVDSFRTEVAPALASVPVGA